MAPRFQENLAPGVASERLLEHELSRIEAKKNKDAVQANPLAVPGHELLKIEPAQLKAAKDAELMKPIRIKFIEDGADRTIDQFTSYPREVKIEGMSAQQTVFELRRTIAQQERLPLEEVNLYGQCTYLEDRLKIGDLYVDWSGFGLEDWPPRLICKPGVRGFEIIVDVPASRDTSIWENGRLMSYFDRQLIFDVTAGTKIRDLKALIARKLRIPPKRHNLTAHIRDNLRDAGKFCPLDDDDKTFGDLSLDKHCVAIKFAKSFVDEKGEFIFDDAYWDSEGYHPPPSTSWIPLDSLADRSRPDANKVDPSIPLNIASDRAQAKAR